MVDAVEQLVVMALKGRSDESQAPREEQGGS
jgi:hypothetical protein